MRKVCICLILLIVLVASTFVGSYADNVSEAIPFSTKLLDIDIDANVWMNDEQTQALFAICAILDYAGLENMPYDISNLYSGSVFVGRLSTALSVGFKDENEDGSLLILFDTGDTSKAYYSVVPFDERELKSTLEEACTDGVYELNSKLLEEVRDAFKDFLFNEGILK